MIFKFFYGTKCLFKIKHGSAIYINKIQQHYFKYTKSVEIKGIMYVLFFNFLIIIQYLLT